MTTATVTTTKYDVTCITEADDDVNYYLFTINVEYAGHGGWAIRWMGRCLNARLEWSYESIPSERTDEWLAEYRFDEQTALELAKRAAPHITVNGRTVASVLARRR